ncbi:hypothetical protein A2U01_0024319 [Trifolium medium]|uniref:Reverse transcriptase domain-containing protein n=1 Tax=Trifolium medium TaxID=97028 RepID=A0A392NTX5_9FABA|nr:hypothetical protein [Trifolium medium]
MISSRMELVLANQSVINAYGMIEDVLVKVEDLVFPVDFVILDIGVDDEKEVILGRPFLATSHAYIDMESGEFIIGIKEEKRTIKVYEKSDNHCCRIETREKELEDAPAKTNLAWADEQIEIDERPPEKSFDEDFHWLERATGEIIPNWYDLFPEPTTFVPRPKSKEHEEWIKRWKRHYKIAAKSKFGVLDEGSEPEEDWWNVCCDDVACEGECGHTTANHPIPTYPP